MNQIISPEKRQELIDRYNYSSETKEIIEKEDLLPIGVLTRLQSAYPQHSGIAEKEEFHFTDKPKYSGLKGYREIVKILEENGYDIGHHEERELFI
jgi:hypothetical protein